MELDDEELEEEEDDDDCRVMVEEVLYQAEGPSG